MNSKINILIIEDSRTYNSVMKSLLSELGYNVLQAYNLAQAQEFFKSENIDYVFLDINLPDGNGVDFIDFIHDNYNSKIIIITGNTDIVQRDAIFKKGIIDYFIKTTPLPIVVNCANTLIQNMEEYKNINILTIDDSNFVRNILKNILQSKNYNVFEASDAKEGSEIIENNDIHLILLDLIMPGIDGISFLENLKSNKKYYNIPVIVVSGDGSRENYARVLKQGASDFIRKPFIVEEVLLKCDIHVQAFFHYKEIMEKQQEILKQETMISLQKKEIEKQKSVSNLSKNIAHQWRQPLSILSLNASRMKLEMATQKYENRVLNDSVDTIVEYIKHLSKTIEDFDLLTLNSNQKSEVLSSNLVKQVLIKYSNFIKNNGIDIIKDIEEIEFKTFSNKLNTVLSIIFENMKEHAKSIKHIFIDVKKEKNSFVLCIKDDGGGIEESLQSKLFEPYFTTAYNTLGKGMGLYIVYVVVKEYFRGEIKAGNTNFRYEDKMFNGFEVEIKIPLN